MLQNEIDIKQAIDKVSGDHKSSVFLTSKLSPFEVNIQANVRSSTYSMHDELLQVASTLFQRH